MRWTLIIVLAMFAFLTGYTVWPIYGLYRIASAVETRNSAALHELIDFPSFRVSLARQIAATHRKKLTGTSADSSERPLTAGVAGMIADAMLAKITLNPDRLLDLLGKGWVSADPKRFRGLEIDHELQLVGCSIGNSTGFAPFRIRAT